MVLPEAADADAPETPWRVHWSDEPNDDERLRSFPDAWALAMPDPEEAGWHFPETRAVVLEAFNAGAIAIRVAWNNDGREVWLHFDAPPPAAP
jgi:hypothetical protein